MTGNSRIIRILSASRTIVIVNVLLAVIIAIRYVNGIDLPLPIVSCQSLWIVLASVGKHPRISIPLATFAVILAISLIIHPTSDYLSRIFRFIAFIVGMLCFSPLIITNKLTKCRRLMAGTLFMVLTIMVCISFLIYLYLLIKGYDIFTPGFFNYGFTGLFNRGMALSPTAAIVATVALWIAVNIRMKTRWKILWLTIALSGTITCIAAGSRMAVVTLLICVIIIAICHRQAIIRFCRTRKGLISVAIVSCTLGLSMPCAVKVINYKQAIADKHNSLLYSREQKWQTRWSEFMSSPILGIGYADAFKEENNLGETPGAFIPGSSWLTVLSYGGIAAAIPFLWFLVELWRRLWHIRSRPEFSLLFALLVFFLLNGVTEGWLMFAGALMFPLFWLTCSEIFIIHDNPCNTEWSGFRSLS